MHDFETLGMFYLGREYDLAARTRKPELLLYDAKDLTTHAVCVGMTGSGKTGLCLALLEEAAIDGVPAIAIDPKGDLGNLLLAFPQMQPSDFRPWIDESEAASKGVSPDDLASQTAATWRDGLAAWGQEPARIQKLHDAVDVAIYTPGSSAGLPLTVLRSFAAPPTALLEDADALRERIGASVSGLLALVGIEADPIRSREHILLAQLLEKSWRAGCDLDIAGLIRGIQSPPLERVGVVDIESFYPAKERQELAMRLNSLLASPSFAAWLEGESLDVGRLLRTAEGRPRLSIISIAHLSDAERMFFVTILLGEILSWIRTQPGTSSLRAILYMDEIFGFFPPTANPPSKTPMLTLLKQARAYGLGIVLATQNPVDLDYKGLSNTGTWFLGRLQTERDKARVLEGLEGASLAAGSKFDKSKMEATLAGLGKRIFLMNNVHDDEPVVFESRWCLSYLRGPLTRGQIQTLMEPEKKRRASNNTTNTPADVPAPDVVVAPAAGAPSNIRAAASSERPLVPPEAGECFMPVRGGVNPDEQIVYRPTLLGVARLHFVDAKVGIDLWKDKSLVVPVADQVPDEFWHQSQSLADGYDQFDAQPAARALFRPIPSALLRGKNYSAWQKSLAAYLHQSESIKLWRVTELKETSRPDESESEFRNRIRERLMQRQQEALTDLQEEFAEKHAVLNRKQSKVQQRVDRKKSLFWSRAIQFVASAISTILNATSSRKWASQRNLRGAATTSSSAGRAARERSDVAQTERELESIADEQRALDSEFEMEKAKIDRETSEIDISDYVVRPKKGDTDVKKVVLAWSQWRD